MEMDGTSDVSYFTRTMANSSLDSWESWESWDSGSRRLSPDSWESWESWVSWDSGRPLRLLSDSYDMSGAKYLYIFNHRKYEKIHFWYRRPAARPDTEEDVRNLTTTFKDQGYKVVTLTDLKYRDIIRVVTAIANQDHSRTSILCIAILTTGKNNNALLAADRFYRLTELEHLLQNGNLVGKPKVLLVNASRAGHVDDGRRLKLNNGKTIVVPTPADSLIMHATLNGHYAFRNSATGSYLIKAVCDALRENSELNFGDFISIVIQKVAARTTWSPNKDLHNKKQSPEARVTLKKSLVFQQLPEVAARTNGSTASAQAP